MERKESENIYPAAADLAIENIVYDDVHTMTTYTPIEKIVSHGNICYRAMAAELPMENIVSHDNICYGQVLKNYFSWC